MITAKVKDRPGLLDDAERLRRAGRNGDHLIAHITPEEAALLKARGGSGTVNPKTGLLEFYDSSYDGGGAGNQNDSIGGGGFASDTTGGGGVTTPGEQLADAIARGDVIDFSVASPDASSFDPWAGTLGGKIGDKAMPSYADTRGLLGMFGDNVRASLQDMAARPGEALANLGLGALVPGYSLMNAAVSIGKPGNSLAGYALDAAKGGVKSEYMGADDNPNDAPPDGFASDSRGGGGEQGQAPFQRTGMFGGETTTDQIVRDAIRRAIVYKPGAYNSWQGNRFVIPDIKW